MIFKVMLLGFLLMFQAVSVLSEERVEILVKGDKSGWEQKEFVGHTLYSWIDGDDFAVLKAMSHGSASGLVKEYPVNLKTHPYLNWSWMVSNPIKGNDELTKKGDDYPARIYVISSGGLFFWKTKALNYVWSSQAQPFKVWDNAYAGANAKMVAIRTSNDDLKVWYHEKRNVYEELRQVFGEEVVEIDAVAIMSDSDDTGGSVTAFYGPIYFTSE